MWQSDTFNATRIDEELSWAQDLGMTTMRVFLHDLAYSEDPSGFKSRVETFLEISARHSIKILIVIFDSCWNPELKAGKQKDPRPGVHNSRWVQSPGSKALLNSSEYSRLETYVKDIVNTFSNDSRILGWDLWNEPDNTDMGIYVDPFNKTQFVLNLLPKVFQWARSVQPKQPLTSGLWKKGYSQEGGQFDEMEEIQMNNSDIITFHSYDPPDSFTQYINFLKKFNRPILCTEYMARPLGSQFETIMPIGRDYNVGLINWGFVNGKTQTHFPWDSWFLPYIDQQPEIWFHDILRTNGTPYKEEEVEMIKRIVGVKAYTADENQAN
uniref:Glycoside hydrolase family 5 domain-containing protein n=1 Tax=Acrobeloides nanus TaxID=290746 RepID=A0A914BXR4_9BILA